MEQMICSQCKYYLQHYVLSETGRLYAVHCGHCIRWKPKNKKPDRKSCEVFQRKEKSPYVTKQYLRIELLKKVLEMELLPEELEE